MPSQIQTIKYACNVCGYAYENYNTAIMCENAANIAEPKIHHIGDVVEFICEDTGLSDTFIMTTFEHGVVLAKVYLTSKNDAGFFEHHVAYIIKYKEEAETNTPYWEERIAIWSKEKKGLYSPSKFHYKQNYHQHLPKNLKLIEAPVHAEV